MEATYYVIVVLVTLECTAEEAPPVFGFVTVGAVVALCVLAIIQFGISV